MRRCLSHAVAIAALALGACSSVGGVEPDFARLFAEAPEDMPARLWLDGDTMVAAAVAIGPGALPQDVRTTIEAVAPRGELLFQGREHGPRGRGFRIEKRYRDGTREHLRSALIAGDGRVLERSHTLAIEDAPQQVLGTALRVAPHVEQVWIVSGPEREELYRCILRDRLGHTLVVDVDLSGRLLRTARRVQAEVTG